MLHFIQRPRYITFTYMYLYLFLSLSYIIRSILSPQGRGVSDEEVRQICFQILREQLEDIVQDLHGPPGPPGVGSPGRAGPPGNTGLQGNSS